MMRGSEERVLRSAKNPRRYHVDPDCRYLRRANRVVEMEAGLVDLEPCKACGGTERWPDNSGGTCPFCEREYRSSLPGHLRSGCEGRT